MSNTPTVRALAKGQNRRLILLTKRITAIGIYCLERCWVEHDDSPKMRDLAHRLLAYEAVEGKTSELEEAATLRVYEKLRQSLGEICWSYRLSVARFPRFDASQVGSSRSLGGADSSGWIFTGAGEFEPQLVEFEPQLGSGKDRLAREASSSLRGYSGCFLDLPRGTLTLRLVQSAWPGAAFDDCNSEIRRKA